MKAGRTDESDNFRNDQFTFMRIGNIYAEHFYEYFLFEEIR